MKYHKIQTIYKRDPETNYKTLLEGQYSIPEFEYLAEDNWVYTEKIDGTNIRVYWKDNNVSFGGRTDNAQIPTTLVNKLTELFPKEKFIEHFNNIDVCLYGEGFGPKIQGGGKYLSEQDFILFDVTINNIFLERPSVIDIAYTLDIRVVPTIGIGTLHNMVNLVKNGIPSTFGNFQAEGVVARPMIKLFTRRGDRIITKLKCKDFN